VVARVEDPRVRVPAARHVKEGELVVLHFFGVGGVLWSVNILFFVCINGPRPRCFVGLAGGDDAAVSRPSVVCLLGYLGTFLFFWRHNYFTNVGGLISVGGSGQRLSVSVGGLEIFKIVGEAGAARPPPFSGQVAFIQPRGTVRSARAGGARSLSWRLGW
jgi:hypothetical protein